MSRISELFALIKSMTVSEKRQFTLLSQSSSGHRPSQHAELFSLLDGIPEGKVMNLKQRIQIAGLHKNLATLIPRLNKQIMDGLAQSHFADSVDGRLYRSLAEIEVLYNKQLLPQCKRMVSWTRGWARNYARTNMELEVLKWERKVLALENQPKLQKALANLRLEETRLIEVLQLQRQLSHLQSEARLLARKGLSSDVHEGKKQIESCHKPELLSLALQTQDRLCILYARNIQGIYHILKKQYEQALTAYLPLIDFWSSNPEWLDDQPELLLMIFNNFHLASMYGRKDLEQLEHFFVLLQNYAFKNPMIRFRFQRITYQAELLTYMNKGEMEKAYDLAIRLEVWLEKENKHLTLSQRLTFSHNLLIVHFLNGSLSMGNRTLLRILSFVGSQTRQDILDFARLMQVVLHFEFGNFNLCENIIRNQLRFFQKVRMINSPYISILKMVRDLLNVPDDLARRKFFAKLEQGIAEENSFLGQEELGMWCRAHVAKHSLKQEFLIRVRKE